MLPNLARHGFGEAQPAKHGYKADRAFQAYMLVSLHGLSPLRVLNGLGKYGKTDLAGWYALFSIKMS